MAKCSPEKLAKAREYREKNRDKILAYFRGRKDVKTAQRRIWNAANRDKQIAANEKAHLKRYHGLTVEQYRAMLAAQEGKCGICEKTPDGAAHCRKLHVDHDHATGAIRGLLCVSCNNGLGRFRDSPALLVKAAFYLNRHAANRNTA